jgi:hypothetical protein
VTATRYYYRIGLKDLEEPNVGGVCLSFEFAVLYIS